MSKNVAVILLAILTIFLSLKALTYLLWEFTEDGGTLNLTLELLLLAILILAGIGFGIGVVWKKIGEPANDEQLKIVGVGVLVLSFSSGVCFGGYCVPAAAISSIFTVIYLVPIIIGLKLAVTFVK